MQIFLIEGVDCEEFDILADLIPAETEAAARAAWAEVRGSYAEIKNVMTMDEYREHLESQLALIKRPVEEVGQEWLEYADDWTGMRV